MPPPISLSHPLPPAGPSPLPQLEPSQPRAWGIAVLALLAACYFGMLRQALDLFAKFLHAKERFVDLVMSFSPHLRQHYERRQTASAKNERARVPVGTPATR